MITFDTPGDIDIRAVTTFGVSSKKDKESAIGYFGTGLKYAIAILLRKNCAVSILTKGTHYKFGINRSEIRFDTFDVVTMNDKDLGFTTELGKNWEMWQAFRELYSNTLDEYGDVYKGVPKNKDGRSYITVSGEEFEKAFNDLDKYFVDDRALVHDETDVVQVLNRPATATIFNKGVAVSTSSKPALYDYNFKSSLSLTEDRTIKNHYELEGLLGRNIMRMTDRDVIRNVVMAKQNYVEHEFVFSSYVATIHGCEVFLDVVGELRKKYKDTGINRTAITVHKELITKNIMPVESCKLTAIEQKQLDKAIAFCKGPLGLELDNYELIIADDLGSTDNLGRADIEKGIMYVSRQCFKEGTKRVAVCLLEEYTHCHYRVADETVEQKWVYLNMITSMGEQIQSEPL